jgi:hypothetical protein
VWQRPQLSLVMKKFAGMMPRTLVSADDGKKGLFGPPPSSSMLAGTIVGFSILNAALRSRPKLHAPSEATAASSTNTAAAPTVTRVPRGERRSAPDTAAAASIAAPATVMRMCVGSSHRYGPAAPKYMIATPKSRPIASTIEPRRTHQLSPRQPRDNHHAKAPPSARPRAMCSTTFAK